MGCPQISTLDTQGEVSGLPIDLNAIPRMWYMGYPEISTPDIQDVLSGLPRDLNARYPGCGKWVTQRSQR